MNKFEIILIVGVAVTILLFILMIVSFLQLIMTNKSLKILLSSRPKDRKKRRRWKKEVHYLESNKSKKLRNGLFALLGALIIGGGSGYTKYYQATTVSDGDTDNIVYSYYLLNQIEQQIKDIDKNDDKKAYANVHTLAVSLSSFASKKGSDRSVKEAQVLLNQYYARVGQFGINLSSQNITELKKDKEKQKDYLADIDRVKQTQKKVITYYKIDESSLKEKK